MAGSTASPTRAGELLKPVKIAGEPIDKLLELLKEPEDRVRYRSAIELGGRDQRRGDRRGQKVARRTGQERSRIYEHHMLEALWLHQSHNVVDVALLKRVLAAPDFHARAAATRVLCYWRDRVPDALDLLRKLAADAHPRVRLEAVRAASFFTVPEAIEIPVIADRAGAGSAISTSCAARRMRALDPIWQKALAEGRTDQVHDRRRAIGSILHNVSTDELIKMKRNRAVFLEMLFRKGVRDEFRREAITGLAKLGRQERDARLARRHSQPG